MMRYFIMLLLAITWPVFVNASYVATVIIIKGQAEKVIEKNSAPILLRQNSNIEEGAVVTTGDRSFVKLVFFDKTQMSIGPNSQIKIAQFAQGSPGLVHLINGQVRTKVEKEFNPENGQVVSKENKFYLRTPTVGMGVRGTDFHVLYNRENKNTALVTYDGVVAMAKMSSREQQPIAEVLSSKDVVLVREGQYSGFSIQQKNISLPTKMSPAQFGSLKANEVLNAQTIKKQENNVTNASTILPPGIDPKLFSSNAVSLEKNLQLSKNTIEIEKVPPPEGFYDKNKEVFAPPAGGFVDLKTAIYLPPPPGSAYDANAKVYVPEKNIGSFDPSTGNYIPPNGFALDAQKGFMRTEAQASTKENKPEVKNKFFIGGAFQALPAAMQMLPPGAQEVYASTNINHASELIGDNKQQLQQADVPVADPLCPNCDYQNPNLQNSSTIFNQLPTGSSGKVKFDISVQ